MARAVTSRSQLEVVKDAPALNNSRNRPGIPRHLIVQLERELAANEITRADLARKYGVTRAAITLFAQRHRARIEQIAEKLDDEFAGLWVASKFSRLSVYQAELEAIEESTFFEHVNAKLRILKAVAEELGQLPPRSQIVVAPVIHVIEGIQMEDLT